MGILSVMDITNYIIQSRDKALLYDDHATYKNQLTRRIASSRKKLGIQTKNRGKYHPRGPITAEEIAENRECVLENIPLPCRRLDLTAGLLIALDMSTSTF